jgi:hypothetical protein
LDCLGPWPFGCENPILRYWISLDFLGFSRSNRDLSMGYTDLSGRNFFSRFSPSVRDAATGTHSRGHAEAQDCSSGKFNHISGYPQAFALPSRIFGSKSCENCAVVASDRASRDARPSGRATATRSRGTQGLLTTPGMLRRSASRNEDSA